MARRRDREPWIRDQFLQFTEGVLACEERTPVERAVAASPVALDERREIKVFERSL
jgi:hypothetical protein